MTTNIHPKSERFTGCLVGLAVGDAVGTSVEFKQRGTFAPITDMLGGGPFGLQAGQWTDDTSMALCLATSLLEQGGFDARDQIERYCRWYREGYLSSTGECFDIGNTVRDALLRFENTGEPMSGATGARSAGNGSIMRLAPIPIFYFHDLAALDKYTVESSRTTHGAQECLDACRLFGNIIHRALKGDSKDLVLAGNARDSFASTSIEEIARAEYRSKTSDEIQGTGYVVKSLEAALWSFSVTSTFEQAILTATNLGDDADTTAAICGQVAGAYYGCEGIPAHWRQRLFNYDGIVEMARRLALANSSIQVG